MRCRCGHRRAWRVWTRNGSYSAFNGYRFVSSDYSTVACEREEGGCDAVWRTKANYVATLRDSDNVGVERREVESGHKGTRWVVAPPDIGTPARLPLTCARCGRQGGPLLGPLSPAKPGHGLGRGEHVVHRDGCEPLLDSAR